MLSIISEQLLFVTPQDVKDFWAITNTLPRNVDVSVCHGKYEASGKSMLGIFGLDLSEPVTMKLSFPDTVVFDSKKFLDSVERWCV